MNEIWWWLYLSALDQAGSNAKTLYSTALTAAYSPGERP